MASNNGVFQASLPKFTGKNYHHWGIQMRVFFGSQYLWNIIENGFDESEQTDDTTLQQIREIKENKRKDRKALFTIYEAVDEHMSSLRESQLLEHPKKPRICYTKHIVGEIESK